MKKILSIMVATFIATTNLWAQFPDPFLADEDRPDGKLWIPAPPSLTGGDFANVVATDAYQAQMKKAREEYQRIRKEQSSGIKERTVTPTTSETPSTTCKAVNSTELLPRKESTFKATIRSITPIHQNEQENLRATDDDGRSVAA